MSFPFLAIYLADHHHNDYLNMRNIYLRIFPPFSFLLGFSRFVLLLLLPPPLMLLVLLPLFLLGQRRRVRCEVGKYNRFHLRIFVGIKFTFDQLRRICRNDTVQAVNVVGHYTLQHLYPVHRCADESDGGEGIVDGGNWSVKKCRGARHSDQI